MISFWKTHRSFGLVAIICGGVAFAMSLLAWWHVERERGTDLEDVTRRAHVMNHRMLAKTRGALQQPDVEAAAFVADRVEGYRRMLGMAVFRPDGRMVTVAKSLNEYAVAINSSVHASLTEQKEVIQISRVDGTLVHVLATPVTADDGTLLGVLAVAHDVSYVDDRETSRLAMFALWMSGMTFALALLVFGAVWTTYERPLRNLAEWMRRLREDDAFGLNPPGIPVALLASESERLAATFRMARSVGEDALKLFRKDKVWTRDRLRAHALDCLGNGTKVVVVSNREPYLHQYENGVPKLIMPAGGLVTALDPILQACGGVWVAHGSGDADRETADAEGRLRVPPEKQLYTLRRVWLSNEEEQGYYYGFSNEGLWPLCLMGHVRPEFRAEEWQHYVRVNQRFADAVLDEVRDTDAIVLVQDCQLALVPRMLKEARPGLRVGIFWHITWPNPETFRICPWRCEILRGMLGADLIGFHLQQYCNNFLDTVDRMLEARVDRDHFAVDLRSHTSLVRPFPISVQGWAERHVPFGEALDAEIKRFQEQLKITGKLIAVGVDRVDYTKGIAERFHAIAAFLDKFPEYRGRFVFVQLGAPSRMHIRRYREHLAELETLADEINRRLQTNTWKPIHFLIANHDGPTVHAFMRMASLCIVSSLHDGMNLVAKEYVAAREDGDGVLILSEFAGAARELPDALIVNPYDIEQFANAIRYAVEMDRTERQTRMERMRRAIAENNVYRWAANFLSELASTRPKSAQETAEALVGDSAEVTR